MFYNDCFHIVWRHLWKTCTWVQLGNILMRAFYLCDTINVHRRRFVFTNLRRGCLCREPNLSRGVRLRGTVQTILLLQHPTLSQRRPQLPWRAMLQVRPRTIWREISPVDPLYEGSEEVWAELHAQGREVLLPTCQKGNLSRP